ncbi:FHA domain-containing protein [Oceanivirga miroungae]|uniref:FHA domain-containing protein n=1 Tax=Oceanivirga miroungae TaxID=1130046 RepID=A0A6I8MBP6_9FUSO|nr:FHA domain-containing protein [Oceanivirga miroungae]VWL84905.1 hypothetical protein OMES3154_00162 [Oceanivirga miroungae]
MEFRKCDMGHIISYEKKECPYCKLVPKNEEENIQDDDILKTKLIVINNIKAVVAWLVNISGLEKGMDYKLKDGRNFIGKSESADVCILGDENIDETNHFSINYNKKQRNFVITPGKSQSIVYVNKKALYETKPIENFSLIEVSNTKLVFVKFVGDNFSWEANV